MRRLHSLLLAIVAAAAATPCAAQTAERPPKPYAPVAIERPKAPEDATFSAFRDALAAAARSRVYAELAALVAEQGFFWDRDFGRGFDPRKPAVDNLAAAIALEHGHGSGWTRLAEFAAEPTAEPLVSRSGVVCAPARPSYDSVAYSKLLDSSYTTGIDWAYPRADRTAVRVAPQAGSAIAATLGPQFVRLLGFEGPDGDPAPGRNQWAHIALPDARTGYVAPGSLMSLSGERLCYIKDLIVGWRIAGYIAGGR